MKLNKKFLATVGSALCLSANAWSYTINSGAIDVGSLDALIATNTNPANQNPATVLSWANSFINPDVAGITRSSPATYFRVDGSTSIYAVALTDTPDYFHLFNANHNALYHNVSNLNWGVFDLTPLQVCTTKKGKTTCNGPFNISGATGTVSHVDSLGGHPHSVPEPTSLGLLAAGLLGLGFARRRAAK